MNWSEGVQAFKSYLLLERGLSKNTVVNYVYDVQNLLLILRPTISQLVRPKFRLPICYNSFMKLPKK